LLLCWSWMRGSTHVRLIFLLLPPRVALEWWQHDLVGSGVALLRQLLTHVAEAAGSPQLAPEFPCPLETASPDLARLVSGSLLNSLRSLLAGADKTAAIEVCDHLPAWGSWESSFLVLCARCHAACLGYQAICSLARSFGAWTQRMMAHGDARAGDYVSRMSKMLTGHALALGGSGEALVLLSEVQQIKWTHSSMDASAVIVEVNIVCGKRRL